MHVQSAVGQNSIEDIHVDWSLKANQHVPTDDLVLERHGDNLLPFLFYQRPVNGPNTKLNLSDLNYDQYNGKIAASDFESQFPSPIVEQFTHSEAGKWYLNIKIFPLRANNGKVEALRDFNLAVTEQSINPKSSIKPQHKLLNKASFAESSVLSSGDWFKIAVGSNAIYRIDKKLIQELGMDVESLELSKFKIFGQPGSLLPEPIEAEKYDDLVELAIRVIDNNSNDKLDDDDLIIFYGEGPGSWKYNSSLSQYQYVSHYSSAFNYYYINADGANGKRIQTLSANQGLSADTTLDYFNHLYHHEKDEYNFLQSGRDWWGNSFKNTTNQKFNIEMPNAIVGSKGFFRHRFTGRTTVRANYYINLNGSRIFTDVVGAVSGDYSSSYHASPIVGSSFFDVNSSTIEVEYNYSKSTADGDAWIDFFDLSVPQKLTYSDEQLKAYSTDAFRFNSVKYQIENGSYDIWNVSSHADPRIQEHFVENGKKSFVIPNSKGEVKFICFKLEDLNTPAVVGKIENQNLHALGAVDYLIISPSSFKSAADKLADFHRQTYNYSVHVVSTEQIYNEFGSGKGDPSSIRNFVKMIYDRGIANSNPLRFLLLFGDGSYDFKDLTKNNTNLVPTFQSRNSFIPTVTYSTDDYYAILEDHEGYLDQNGAKEGLDLGVGRIPAGTIEEANLFVDKVIRYHDPKTYGDWRNRLTFLGDDEDGNQHFRDTEVVTAFILSQKKEYNVNKIYLDAFEQVSFGSGQKYPEVNIAINKSFEKGQLIFNYLGHGGGSGMAHERVITRDQILSWSNTNATPLVVTATCELSRFDDPAEESPGELMLFDNDGGAIALITTTRLVIIGNNSDLNEQIFDENIFFLHDGEKPTLGQVYSRCKNKSARNVNQRNFILLGDPAMKIAYPEYKVITTSINDSLIGVHSLDTLKAFERVKVSGAVTQNGEILNDFNGFVYPTIFDKFATYRTLANDPESYQSNYRMQNSVLYRGKVSVINGEFSFQFIVPKDIAYEYGSGKISYYAENGNSDGHGFQDNFFIGGSGKKITDDDKGPDIELYLDHENFAFGGTTNTRPVLFAELFDENGINTVGNGIGRDLLAIIDEGTKQEQILVLNDFYAAKLDSYQEGEIRYEMEELAPGRHTLKVRVWDVYNNSSEAYTEFVVANNDDLSIAHVLNYPNPFTTNTTFHFDHNKVGQELDVSLKIFTVAGNLVKSFNQSEFAQSGHFQDISWNGRDEYGDRLARGVYLYKLDVKSEDGSENTVFQKLLLLK